MPLANIIPDVSRIVQETLPATFSRRRGKLGPARTFLTVVHMSLFGRRGYRRVVKELLTGSLADSSLWGMEQGPSASAICQSRKKLKEEHYKPAYDAIYEACTKARQRPSRTYKGLHICALDGTNLQLPCSASLSQHFGHPTNMQGQAQHPMAGFVLLWNVSSSQPIAWTLSPYGVDERQEGLALCKQLPPTSILITDRGYPSFAVFQALCERNQPFLMRIKNNFYKGMAEHIDQEGNDCLYTFQGKNHHGKPLGERLTLRLISVTLASGEREVLVTNLFSEDGHRATALGKLYTTRWHIETAFKDMKLDYALESFSATYPEGIIQEIYAIMIFVLLRSELDATVRLQHRQATKACNTKAASVEYQFNQSMICDTVHGLLRRRNSPIEEIEHSLRVSLSEIYRYKTKPRPGRAFPRKGKSEKS